MNLLEDLRMSLLNPRSQEEKIIKDIRIFFKTKRRN